MDQRLIAYVEQERNAGYSDQQIAQALKSQGYPDSLVNAVLNAPKPDYSNDVQIIKGYVNQYLSQGYTEIQIKEWLKNQGYPASLINAAFPKQHKHSPGVLIIFPIIAVLLLIGGFFLISDEPPTPHVIKEPLELKDVMDNLVDSARTNPDLALAICDQVVTDQQERCEFLVAKSSRSPSFCSRLNDPELQDTCYLEFIYTGAYEYCDRLQLQPNIEYCETIKVLSDKDTGNV